MLKFTMYSHTFEDLPQLKNGTGTLLLNQYLMSKEYQDIFMSDFCKNMVKDIDKSEIISPYNIKSPILGSISPRKISGGTSMLIGILFLCYQGKNFYFQSSGMGDNCADYLLKIAEKYDLNMFMSNYFKIFFRPNLLYCVDEERLITSQDDLESTYLKHNYNYMKECELIEEPDYEFTNKQIDEVLNRK